MRKLDLYDRIRAYKMDEINWTECKKAVDEFEKSFKEDSSPSIITFIIETAMGSCRKSFPPLNYDELKEFNNIGYSGKTSDGKFSDRQTYLNSLGKGSFQVTQTKHDSGDFVEEFTIVWVK